MLIDKLLFAVGVEDDGEAVKAANNAVKLEAVHQKHRDDGLVLSSLVEEEILEILRFLHFSQLLYVMIVLLLKA